MTSATSGDEDSHLELIAFRIAQQDYCVEIKRVREIRGWTPATRLPHAPAVFIGMINLRGTVIPVIDLSARMGFAPTMPSDRNAIVVVEIAHQILGLLVEAVSEILSIESSRVQPTPAVGSAQAESLVLGVISDKHRIMSVLALDQIAEIGREVDPLVANSDRRFVSATAENRI